MLDVMPPAGNEVGEREACRLILLLHHRDYVVQQQYAAQATVAVTDFIIAIPVDALAYLFVKASGEVVFFTIHICIKQLSHAQASGVEQVAGQVVEAFVAEPFAQGKERIEHLIPKPVDECPLVVAVPLVVIEEALEVTVSEIRVIGFVISLVGQYVEDIADARAHLVLPACDESPESIVGQRLLHHVPLHRDLELAQADCLAAVTAGEV